MVSTRQMSITVTGPEIGKCKEFFIQLYIEEFTKSFFFFVKVPQTLLRQMQHQKPVHQLQYRNNK